MSTRENPSVAAVGLPILGLTGAGLVVWRKMQRDKFSAMLASHPVIGLATAAHRQELLDERVPWFGTVSADAAYEELVGHPEGWLAWSVRSGLPGAATIQQTLANIPSGRGAANRAQDTGLVKTVRSWFGDVGFGSY